MMMAKRAFPSLSIAAALVFSVKNTSPSSCDSPRNNNGGTVKEPFTGIEFPRIREDSDHTNYLLLGTAVRCMLGQCKFAKARAYAVGLYVEDGKQQGQWMPEGIPNSNTEVIFSQVLREPIARRLVLVMDKDVAGHHIAKVWRPDDLLIISINSSVRAVIPSPILCRAVFDMYLGPDSIFKKYKNMSFTLVEMTGL